MYLPLVYFNVLTHTSCGPPPTLLQATKGKAEHQPPGSLPSHSTLQLSGPSSAPLASPFAATARLAQPPPQQQPGVLSSHSNPLVFGANSFDDRVEQEEDGSVADNGAEGSDRGSRSFVLSATFGAQQHNAFPPSTSSSNSQQPPPQPQLAPAKLPSLSEINLPVAHWPASGGAEAGGRPAAAARDGGGRLGSGASAAAQQPQPSSNTQSTHQSKAPSR